MIEAYATAEGYEDAETVEATLTVHPRPLTLTIGSEEATYTGSEVNRDLAVTPEAMSGDVGLVSGQTVTPAPVRASRTAVGVTSYGGAGADNPVDFTISGGNDNYTVSIINGMLTVNPYRIDVEIDPGDPTPPPNPDAPSVDPSGAAIGAGNSKVYGKVDPALTVKLPANIPAPQGGAALTADRFELSRAAGEDVDSYAIAVDNLAALQQAYADSYEITYTQGYLSILHRPVELRADDAAKVYGQEDPALAATATDLAGGGAADLPWFDFGGDFPAGDMRAERNPAHTGRENANDGGRLGDETEIGLVVADRAEGVQDNYYITDVADGALTITRRPLGLRASGGGVSFVADGTRKGISGYTIDPATEASGLLATHTLSNISAGASASVVGRHYTQFTGSAVITDQARGGENLAGNYALSTQNTYFDITAPNDPPASLVFHVDYYADSAAGGGTFLGRATLDAAANADVRYRVLTVLNDYRDAANALDNGSRYSADGTIATLDTVIRGDGQVINVVYTPDAGGPGIVPLAVGPGPGGLFVPGGPEAPEVIEPVAPVVPIDPVEVPRDRTEGIDTPETPLAEVTVYWALLNLIIAILALLLAIVLIAGIFSRRRSEEAEETVEQERARRQRSASGEEAEEPEANKGKTGLLWRIFAVITGVLSPIIFLLTENVRNPMIFVDKWTLLMVILLAVQLVLMLVLRKIREPKDRNSDEENGTPAQA